MKEILIFISNEYADWEIGYIGAEIRKTNKYKISTVAINKEVIISMGGLNVNPTYCIDEVLNKNIENFQMLILCGGESWKKEKYENQSVKKLVDMFKENNKPISAICDATTFLAFNGYLNQIEHTGNSVDYIISTCPNYIGKNNYIEKQCVRTDCFITANGTATLEFSREIMKSLGLKTEEEIDNWYKFNKNGFYSE
ncbi:DJ-1/PfpI family protein [Clostridium saccharobutylicum]|uniref:Putative protease YdeA n=1 Tax=Clostridium saccharobutylicum TaxID=169679 RepID=A0A1S8NDM2_CLOSA|nr:DJ-1/PfpI family protein [Clostridium saccharobutylicum]OOM14584.1 putative protease YdeA [Clostridium saccharobutylicum]